MNDARLMRLREPVGQAPLQGHDVFGAESGIGFEILGKRWSVDIFHCEIWTAEPRGDREDVVSNDRIMGEMIEDARFLAEEVEDQLILGIFGQHDLDRHRIAGLDIVTFENLAHSADADQRIDLVDVVELRAGRNTR